MLGLMLDRLARARHIDNIVVATTDSPSDSAIVDFCHARNVSVFCGAEDDVLTRYYECAREYDADVILRLTSDCPLCDPCLVDASITPFLEAHSDLDFLANTVPVESSCFPDGSDIEVFTMAALTRAYNEVKDMHDREHVTFYFWKYTNGFKTRQIMQREDWSNYRFTVDYPEDIELITRLVALLKEKKQFGHLPEIIALLKDNPELPALNAQYYAGIGWEQ